MKLVFIITVLNGFLLTIGLGLAAAPFVFVGRIVPGVILGDRGVGGILTSEVPGIIEQYSDSFLQQPVTLRVGPSTHQETLRALGLVVDQPALGLMVTRYRWREIIHGRHSISPPLRLTTDQFHQRIGQLFRTDLAAPQNAALQIIGSQVVDLPAKRGENADSKQFAADLSRQWWHRGVPPEITLVVVSMEPAIVTSEVEKAHRLTEQLLVNGFTLRLFDQSFIIPTSTVRGLVEFYEQPDPNRSGNLVLGVRFKAGELETYLTRAVASQFNQTARDARFQLVGGRVEQFDLPQTGRRVDIPATVTAIQTALQASQGSAAGTVQTTEPKVADLAGIESLGITTLLGYGESDFSGSPSNRIHNIAVGTTRYHGLLIPPGEEFSFNEFLGPVTAATGYKPELVIKNNRTIPEFGGGLCQVSTTLFRAALRSGLPITERKNHAYAVRYYGKAGFDATIYPPNVDLKFRNDTAHYVLIQAKIEKTKLLFELWGTSDGRQVTIEGPFTYDHESNGAVRATLHQKVDREGKPLFEKTFYSRYKSPLLYPKTIPVPTP